MIDSHLCELTLEVHMFSPLLRPLLHLMIPFNEKLAGFAVDGVATLIFPITTTVVFAN